LIVNDWISIAIDWDLATLWMTTLWMTTLWTTTLWTTTFWMATFEQNSGNSRI
jgi:hypothetical protein